MENDRQPQNRLLQVPRMITGVMTGSLAIFLFVAYSTPLESSAGYGESVNTALSGLSAALLTVSLFTRQWFFRFFASSSKRERGEYLAGEFFQAQLFTLMLRESAVVVCFLLTFVSGNMDYVLYAAIAGAILNLATWPREIPKK